MAKILKNLTFFALMTSSLPSVSYAGIPAKTADDFIKLVVRFDPMGPGRMDLIKLRSTLMRFGSGEDVNIIGNRYLPRFNSMDERAASIFYEFAVRNNIITDAASLIEFTKTIIPQIYSSHHLKPLYAMFLSSQRGYTLSSLKSVKSEIEINFIRQGMNLLQVYEELVRNGVLAKYNKAPDDTSDPFYIMSLLSWIHTDISTTENPEVAEKMQERLKVISLAFIKDFVRRKPSFTHAYEYRRLTGIHRFDYYQAEHFGQELPEERDYSLELVSSPGSPYYGCGLLFN